MKYFRTVYSEALFKFPMDETSIFEIISDDSDEELYRYGSFSWNIDHFVKMLSNQVPKAVNLLFIPEEFWIYEKDAFDMDLCFWIGLQKYRNEFVTYKYANMAYNVINMHMQDCIRNPMTASRANPLDLVRIAFWLEIAISTITYREVDYPMFYVLNDLDSLKTKHELISRILGREMHLKSLIKGEEKLEKEVSDKTQNKVLSLRERMCVL